MVLEPHTQDVGVMHLRSPHAQTQGPSRGCFTHLVRHIDVEKSENTMSIEAWEMFSRLDSLQS